MEAIKNIAVLSSVQESLQAAKALSSRVFYLLHPLNRLGVLKFYKNQICRKALSTFAVRFQVYVLPYGQRFCGLGHHSISSILFVEKSFLLAASTRSNFFLDSVPDKAKGEFQERSRVENSNGGRVDAETSTDLASCSRLGESEIVLGIIPMPRRSFPSS